MFQIKYPSLYIFLSNSSALDFTYVDALKLLEEAHAHTNSCASPPLDRKEVKPLHNLQFEPAHTGMVTLQHDGLEFHFSQDATILGLNTIV